MARSLCPWTVDCSCDDVFASFRRRNGKKNMALLCAPSIGHRHWPDSYPQNTCIDQTTDRREIRKAFVFAFFLGVIPAGKILSRAGQAGRQRRGRRDTKKCPGCNADPTAWLFRPLAALRVPVLRATSTACVFSNRNQCHRNVMPLTVSTPPPPSYSIYTEVGVALARRLLNMEPPNTCHVFRSTDLENKIPPL